MIGKTVKEYLVNEEIDIVKPADEVAVVNTTNTLEHALLIFLSEQYSSVPVLDNDSKVCGVISLAKIMQSVVEMDEVRYDKLSEILVQDIIDKNYHYVYEDFELEEVLSKVVASSFITVLDKNHVFKGIITRSEILKGLNYLAHNLENDYNLLEDKLYSLKNT